MGKLASNQCFLIFIPLSELATSEQQKRVTSREPWCGVVCLSLSGKRRNWEDFRLCS